MLCFWICGFYRGLALEWNLAVGIAKRPTKGDAFELLAEVIRVKITYW